MWAASKNHIDPYFHKQHYFKVLQAAVQESIEYDQREIREVIEALSWMESNAPGLFGVRRFRRSLEIPSPAARFEALAEALHMIERGA